MKIAPSILNANFLDLKGVLEEIKTADMIHLDIMDGHFVRNISFGSGISGLISKATSLALDVHLMTTNPCDWINKFTFTNTKYITFHVENDNPDKVIELIRSNGIIPGISLRPGTNVTSLNPYLPHVGLVLVMSVEPGFGGQAFMEGMLEKVKYLADYRRLHQLEYQIEIDGGIDYDNAIKAKMAGADIVVIGSYLFKSDSVIDTIKAIQKL